MLGSVVVAGVFTKGQSGLNNCQRDKAFFEGGLFQKAGRV